MRIAIVGAEEAKFSPEAATLAKERNLLIAQDCDILYNIVVDQYPPTFVGRKFGICYHCAGKPGVIAHVKSGGCWTAYQALRLGKAAHWYVISQDGTTCQTFHKVG